MDYNKTIYSHALELLPINICVVDYNFITFIIFILIKFAGYFLDW